jgi:capsular exopolysaccharide synthesis family protein
MVAFLNNERDSEEKKIQTIVHDEPKSPFAESFKGLRTAIMLSSADTPPTHILITSMGPGEGKTTTAINLAMAVAQAGRSVILVDADLRRPTVHKTLGVSNNQGLSMFLTGSTNEVETHKGPIGNLDIITSGPIPPNPSELLDSERFRFMISKLEEKYDFIICDSPPMLSVTDPVVLSKRFHGTVIVARAGKTPYEAVRKGLRQLADIEAHVLGLFINAYRLHRSGYYYGQYDYYYSYAYAYNDKDSRESEDSR